MAGRLELELFELSSGKRFVVFRDPTRDRDGRLDSFFVHLREHGLEATVRVENSIYIQGPEVFFKELADSWTGWTGEKVWRSLEGEFKLVATADAIGHIVIEVQLQPTANEREWRAVSWVHVEAGQLESLSIRAKEFFAHCV